MPGSDAPNRASPAIAATGATAVADGWLLPSGPLLPGGSPVTLIDDSACRRSGFKGAGTTAWLEARGLALPDKPNRLLQTDGLTIARLGDEEYLLLADADSAATLDALDAACAAAASAPRSTVARVPRESAQACLAMTGAGVPMLLARSCAADCSVLVERSDTLMQTMVAGCPVLILPYQHGLLLCCDRAVTIYLIDCFATIAGAL